jgi:MraZ protein
VGKCGKTVIDLRHNLITSHMTNLIGEFEVSMDYKGRIMLPAALKRQISPEAMDWFVINRGFEPCLVIYPMDVWKLIRSEVDKLNLYVTDNRIFIRNFYNGATEVQLDGSNRLLLPKKLLDYGEIVKDIILFAYSNRIEVWAKSKYEEMMKNGPVDFAALAEKVMGKSQKPDNPADVS